MNPSQIEPFPQFTTNTTIYKELILASPFHLEWLLDSSTTMRVAVFQRVRHFSVGISSAPSPVDGVWEDCRLLGVAAAGVAGFAAVPLAPAAVAAVSPQHVSQSTGNENFRTEWRKPSHRARTVGVPALAEIAQKTPRWLPRTTTTTTASSIGIAPSIVAS
ncbi:hypothetical protein ZTR_08830 [Talaromyces verruculosus]|nr:hypothetical protein ZTR_08830 [Talaromyces verruculosus]